ncbi:hypothetical protein DPEC_G00069310 [Dallia pectoralis]|uniref:Uncharacterized protein n=1 Tax=Dallia pectoralis TaxID=75939 RepID=A0ACC2H1X2_DALPE|nr:hypothetical protein DPEC_G00069310 [Dallia pectoralis]
MKLNEPVIEFRWTSGTLCARSTADHRWYKVQGITKTLDSMVHHRKPSPRHNTNMISMDLFTRVVRDLNANPESSLDWVPEYVVNLNAPEDKGATFKDALLQLFRSRALTPAACRRLWTRSRMSTGIGIAVDSQCKDVFNRKKTTRDVGPVSRLVLMQLEALCLTPICAGLKVASVPRPDMGGKPGSYTYHNGCTRGCKPIRDPWGFYTEVDLVAHDTVKDTVALLELKTRNNDILDRSTLWRYNTQLWLTWLMFSLTYPSMAERSTAYLLIIRPGTNHVTVRSCLRPTMSKSIRAKFPWLNCFCPQVLNCLAPMCVNMRVETQLASAAARRTDLRVDTSDLCYRNILFNQEKLKAGRL